MRSHLLPPVLAFLVLALLAPTAVQADDDPAYEASPSLEVPTDLDRPFPLLGIQADLVGVFFQRYALRGEVSAAPAHSFWFSPSFSTAGADNSLRLEVGYHLWPFADGLDGLFIGPAIGLDLAHNADPHAFVTSLEAGYQWYMGGVTLTANVGVTNTQVLGQSEPGEPWGSRVSVSLGYAWM